MDKPDTPFLTEEDAEQSWEFNNKHHPTGINPSAYTLGYKAASKKANAEIKKLREERDDMEKQLFDARVFISNQGLKHDEEVIEFGSWLLNHMTIRSTMNLLLEQFKQSQK